MITTRQSWDSRAAWHGKRLAREGYRSLRGDTIGSLAWHEGADVTVQAMDDFAAKLQAAFRTERDRLDAEERAAGFEVSP